MFNALLIRRLRWFFLTPWMVWVCLGTVLIAVLFIWVSCWMDVEGRLRWAGTALQLLGLVTTALGIHQTRKLFGHPSIFAQAARWLADRPKRNSTIRVGAGALIAEGGDAIVAVEHVGPAPGLCIEQRLQWLEDWRPLIEQQTRVIDQTLFGRPMDAIFDASTLHRLVSGVERQSSKSWRIASMC